MSKRTRGVLGSNISTATTGSDHEEDSDNDDALISTRRQRGTSSRRRVGGLSTGQWTFMFVAIVTIYIVHVTPPPEDTRPRHAPEPFNPQDVWEHMMDRHGVVQRLQTAHPKDVPPPFAPLPHDYAESQAKAADHDYNSASPGLQQPAVEGATPAEAVTTTATVKETGKTKTIAWVVAASQDGPFMDGAAVLKRAVELAHPSPPVPATTTSADSTAAASQGEFDHAFVAICHPEATKSRDALAALGWRILEVAEPVGAHEIQGKFLKSHILKSGCCGARELLKLYAWTLTDYWRVVLLDMDSLVLGSFDALFRTDASLLYTCDYNMMAQGVRAKLALQQEHQEGADAAVRACPVQGGFAVVRPSVAVFIDMVAIVKEGNFQASGWGGTSIGGWWGGATFQGVVPYYYATRAAQDTLRDGPAVEIDRCIYNNMVDKGVTAPGPHVGASECRDTPLDTIKNVHFTLCQKPWDCAPSAQKNDRQHVCLALHKKWHQIRANLEVHLGLPSTDHTAASHLRGHQQNQNQEEDGDWTLGHCRNGPHGKYIPMPPPKVVTAAEVPRVTAAIAAPSLMKSPPQQQQQPEEEYEAHDHSVAQLDSVAPLRPTPRRTIAWAISVSKDGPFVDGAAVLLESIKRTHHNPHQDGEGGASGGSSNQDDGEGGGYGHAFIALVHPNATKSMPLLTHVGWEVRIKAPPVQPHEIATPFVRKHAPKSGCCGLSELIKLYAWTLTEFWRVVHLDMDSLVLGPMHELFGRDASLIYTCDYNMMNKNARAKNPKAVCAVQGGFAVVRPSMAAFNTMVVVMREGRFGAGVRPGASGWNGTGIGHWWGGVTFQGLVPFYYAKVPQAAQAGPALEVDRCVYDNMVDDPVDAPMAGSSDCRAQPLNTIKNVHFTLCQKPWSCNVAQHPDDLQHLCMALHTQWFALRKLSEQRHQLADTITSSSTKYHNGACSRGKYVPMAIQA